MFMKQTVVVVGLVLLGLLASWLIASKALLINQNPIREQVVTPQPNPKTAQRELKIGKEALLVETRQTEAELELGLSWREQLGENEGMVFVYPVKQKVAYWMQGMQFPLDFLWVAGGKVVEITESIPAPTKENPVVRTVSPLEEVEMVIEVNAGWIKNHTIRVGDAVVWQKP